MQTNDMSTSVHMHVEVKKDGQWQHYSAPHIPTDHTFYDLISGVYGKICPIAAPRGLPSDLSSMTAYCYALDEKNFSRLHHQSWLGPEELLRLQQQLNELLPTTNPLDRDLEEGYLRCYINNNAISAHRGFDDSRIVFWFDN